MHEFFVEGGDPGKSHVLLNITEPATPEEKDKGYFFAICEINDGDTKYIAKMQDLIDEIENSYYEIPDEEDKTSLETILDKVNKESFSVINPDITLNCIVGAIRQNDILFSLYGRPQMLLFYRIKDGTYKKMDLAEENQNAEPKTHQLFSQIVQGKIGANDYFFASTPHLNDYFNHDRLQKIVTTRSPRQSAEHLQRVLSELKNFLSFGGIIIHMQKPAEPDASEAKPVAKKGDSAKSLNNLFNTERNTTNILSPSLLPRLQDRMNDVFKQPETAPAGEPTEKKNYSAEIQSAHLRSHQAVRKHNFDFQQFLAGTFKIIWRIIKFAGKALLWIGMLILAIITGFFRNLLLLFFVITNFKGRRHNIVLEWSQGWKNFKGNMKRLPLATKLLMIASVLLALVFAGSLVYLKINQKKQAEVQAYKNLVRSIQSDMDAATSSLIYVDTAQALSKINDAKQILQTLPCKTAEQKLTCDDINGQLDSLTLEARKVTVVTPQVLADWSVLSPGTQIDKIVTVGEKIIGISKSTSSLFVYDPLTKDNKIIQSNVAANGFIAAAVPKESDYVALLSADNTITEFNPQDNSTKKIDVSFPNQNIKISAIAVYSRKLYSLDTQNNQIYKHDPIKTGFSIGKAWVKSAGTDLSLGVDLAIDGDVFVLQSDGKIDKFTSGENVPFAISGLDPQMSSGSDIWTYSDLNYIYALDPANSRLVIIDKTGNFSKQITAPEFTGLGGMSVDESKSTAVILSGDKLYQINWQ